MKPLSILFYPLSPPQPWSPGARVRSSAHLGVEVLIGGELPAGSCRTSPATTLAPWGWIPATRVSDCAPLLPSCTSLCLDWFWPSPPPCTRAGGWAQAEDGFKQGCVPQLGFADRSLPDALGIAEGLLAGTAELLLVLGRKVSLHHRWPCVREGTAMFYTGIFSIRGQ